MTRRILGLSGLFGSEAEDYPPGVPSNFFHDAAAALVVDGEVVAAVEEERLNREKHTNRFPVRAAKSCLEQGGIEFGDVDLVAYFFDEAFTDRELMLECYGDPELLYRGSRELICEALTKEFGAGVSQEQVRFVKHHMTHAEVAYRDSPFSEALVGVIDGNGECEGVTFYAARDGVMTPLRAYPRSESLGHFYTAVTRFLGYSHFDEYKVMGLAPYGDPERYFALLDRLRALEGDGQYRLDVHGVPGALLDAGLVPRRVGGELTQTYADLAAAAQRIIEDTTEHLVRHWQGVTQLRNFCLSGGVAQNTTLNGKLLSGGLFDGLHVHPASHDGGAALGAAYAVDREARPRASRPPRLPDPYLGPALGDEAEVEQELSAWRDFVDWEKPADIVDAVAQRLADGEIGGWAQGRSEYGPRALGNRSILADPRPASHRDRVNALIKNRESYRPLAPAVVDSAASTYFVLPGAEADYGCMGFVVDVRPEHRERLGAVTHVDGTARVQVVTQCQNPLFRSLIERFGELTGTPVLLNTSFNNNAEPIVQSARDAVTCLLTTGLPWVALGPYLVRKRSTSAADIRNLSLALSPFCLVESRHDVRGETWQVRGRTDMRRACQVRRRTAQVLTEAGRHPGARLSELLESVTSHEDEEPVLREVGRLWEKRLVRLTPLPGPS
jgi:predicted NodU family carbamoyl transferase